jgi:hypothetical protein
MQYLLLIAGEESRMNGMTPADMESMMGAYMAYTKALIEAGVMRGGNALQPAATATTVRVRDGKTQVLDGPYVEAKEQLGGYYVIEAPDLDTALHWAARCPGAATGAMEVRPIMETPPVE